MTSIHNGYYKGIILIFGSDQEHKKSTIQEFFQKKADPDRISLIFHDHVGQQPRII